MYDYACCIYNSSQVRQRTHNFVKENRENIRGYYLINFVTAIFGFCYTCNYCIIYSQQLQFCKKKDLRKNLSNNPRSGNQSRHESVHCTVYFIHNTLYTHRPHNAPTLTSSIGINYSLGPNLISGL